jgi:hypothetical protein
LFAGFPVQPLPVRSEIGDKTQDRATSADSSAAEPNPFFCDDPKTG